jgi:multidrug resistance efflux pump
MSAQAPFDGTLDLSKGFKKPGDPVKTGDILFAMRIDTGLQDQLNDAKAQAAKAQTTANAYHADRTKQAEYAEAMAEYESQKAKVALFQGRIDRAVVKSTVDGYVLKGDLRGRDGAAVRQEDVLMEVGPIANLDIELHVPERDIQLVHTGQKGALATATFPGDSYGFTVGQIVPMGVPKDGGNYLTVYATADKAAGSWRPGMVGEAKIDIEKKPLVWIWTHRLNEFIQMKLWQWR